MGAHANHENSGASSERSSVPPATPSVMPNELVTADLSPALRAISPTADAAPAKTTETVTFCARHGAGVITLGDPSESVISFTTKRMASFERALDEAYAAYNSGHVRGLVIRAPALETTCAGADLKMLGLVQSRDIEGIKRALGSAEGITSAQKAELAQLTEATLPELAARLSMNGKRMFERVRDFPGGSVGAASGMWVGGFAELLTYCRIIVAAEPDSPFKKNAIKSQFGFPEPMLGILEGWGGTQTVTEKVGLPTALKLLMAGSLYDARYMHKLGLFDKLVPQSQLFDFVERVARGEVDVQRHQMSAFDKFLTYSAPGRHIVVNGVNLGVWKQDGARASLKKYPFEHYPAPHRIMECAIEGARRGYEAGAALESKRFGELLTSPQARALTHVVFFGTEAAKSHGKGVKFENVNALVCGAGKMGAGIGVLFAKSGARVTMRDIKSDMLDGARTRLEDALKKDKRLTSKDKDFVLDNVRYTTDRAAALPHINFAIEAVFEERETKKDTLSWLSSAVPAHAIVASNTSSIPMSELSQWVQHPERFIGIHYFNPPEEMKLAELIKGPHTSPETLATAAAVVAKQGKYPIVVEDCPGFLINRMVNPYFGMAVQLVLEGFPIEMIDQVMTKDFGMVMGPIRTLDKVGLNVGKNVQAILEAAYPDRMQAPTVVGLDGKPISWTKVAERFGKESELLGEASGKGFYLHRDAQGKAIRPIPNPIFSTPDFWKQHGLQFPVKKDPTAAEIKERLMLPFINEAVRCYDEGIAGPPGPKAVLQVNMGAVMGIGYAPSKGGPLMVADAMGFKALEEAMLRLAEKHGVKYVPWEGIRERARTGAKIMG